MLDCLGDALQSNQLIGGDALPKAYSLGTAVALPIFE
jgi:hypothetical protein